MKIYDSLNRRKRTSFHSFPTARKNREYGNSACRDVEEAQGPQKLSIWSKTRYWDFWLDQYHSQLNELNFIPASNFYKIYVLAWLYFERGMIPFYEFLLFSILCACVCVIDAFLSVISNKKHHFSLTFYF